MLTSFLIPNSLEKHEPPGKWYAVLALERALEKPKSHPGLCCRSGCGPGKSLPRCQTAAPLKTPRYFVKRKNGSSMLDDVTFTVNRKVRVTGRRRGTKLPG